MQSDSYKTIKFATEGIFKDRSSKFISYAYPVRTEEEVGELVKALKKQYFDARHHCYAFRLGAKMDLYRAADDGEPPNSAGIPILNQIRSAELTNILIVVVRYFGGTLLGVPGLINAYKNASADALAKAEIIECTVNLEFILEFSYETMNKVMKVVKDDKLDVLKQDFDMVCKLTVSIRKNAVDLFLDKISKIEGVQIEQVIS